MNHANHSLHFQFKTVTNIWVVCITGCYRVLKGWCVFLDQNPWNKLHFSTSSFTVLNSMNKIRSVVNTSSICFHVLFYSIKYISTYPFLKLLLVLKSKKKLVNEQVAKLNYRGCWGHLSYSHWISKFIYSLVHIHSLTVFIITLLQTILTFQLVDFKGLKELLEV